MHNKTKLMLFILLAVFFCAASSQAALVELQGLTDVQAGVAGSQTFDVVLTDLDGVPHIDSFNLWIGVSGPGAVALTADPAANTYPGYIFPAGPFYSTGNMAPLEVFAADSDGMGNVPGMLAQLTLDYGPMALGDELTFALMDPSQNFGTYELINQFPLELVGDVNIEAVPLPAAIWLFGSGVLGIIGLRRKMKK